MADPANLRSTQLPPRWRRGHLITYFFFAALAGPATDIIDGRARPAWLAGVTLAAFAACFVLLVELAYHPGAPGPSEALSLRRRQINRALFGVLIALAVAATIGFGRGWLPLFLFVVAASAFSVPVRWAPVGIAAITAIAVATEVGWNEPNLSTAASWTLSIGLSGFLSLLMRKRAVLIQELRAAQGEVARRAAADAVIDERLRFARDLHDLLGHSLSVIALKAELARRLLERDTDRDKARAEVGDIEQIARRALDEVREAVSGYRARSLAMELERARAALEAAGAAVTVRVAPAALPRDVDDLLAWVVREAATNIVRHSRARRAEIALDTAGGVARLDIANDGVAAAASTGGDAPGSGLAGLRERVTAAGGELAAAPEAGGRFRVAACVRIPIAAADRELGAVNRPGTAPLDAAPALRDEVPR
jgi:two-component system, NarL family, sensor histidine kinase DesK